MKQYQVDKSIPIDRILVSILQKRLKSITEEMSIAMVRTTRSPILCEARDFVTGLYDYKGDMLEQKENLPILAFSLQPVCKYIIDYFGDDIHDGDVIFHNDVFSMGNQNNDVAAYKPIFWEGELVAWAAVKGHQADIGGNVQGGYNPEATEVWQETLRITPVKVYEKGELRKDVWDLIFANVRLDIVQHDMKAEMGACTVGERRLLELLKKYGVESYESHKQALFDATRKMMEAEIAKIPGSKNQARYNLPVGAHIFIKEGDEVFAGDVLVKIPRETTKIKDITGGLPRVVELFEARRPKECSVVTEIDGEVSYGKDTKGKRKVTISPEIGSAKDYMIPKNKHVSVHEGDFVRAGEPLMDGAVDPHDILRIRGEKDLAKYLVNEVQEVYRLQGVRINDKHIEVIVRQMLKRVRIKDAGDTANLEGEYVDKHEFGEENERVVSAGGKPAIAEPSLLGITKASLNTESFISAASFQETTRVLTEASVEGKVDHLVGLKENVIMGRLIPAGTGFPIYNRVDIKVEEEDILDDDL